MHTLKKYGLLFHLVLGFIAAMPASGQQIKIVGHQVGPPNELDTDELRDVFKAQKQWWSSDTKISIVLLKSSVPVSEVVAEKVFDMSPRAVKTYWIQIVFRGKATTPKHFDSEESVVDYIARTPGAIGVVSAETDTRELKVISIAGKAVW